MFKLVIFYIYLNIMSLSKKNLDKLNNFVKKASTFNHNKSIKNFTESYNSTKTDYSAKVFYSIIENSENINETSEPNQILKKSEESIHISNSAETSYSNNLSLEDLLYEEFDYLLEE